MVSPRTLLPQETPRTEDFIHCFAGLGVGENCLRAWKAAARDKGADAAFPGQGHHSAADEELRRLNRRHTSSEIHNTFDDLARAGFANVSFDLIAGLPGQTPAAFERNLDAALALRPAHLSFYILEVHEGTPLARRIERGRLRVPDEDLAAEMYRALLRRTSSLSGKGTSSSA